MGRGFDPVEPCSEGRAVVVHCIEVIKARNERACRHVVIVVDISKRSKPRSVAESMATLPPNSGDGQVKTGGCDE